MFEEWAGRISGTNTGNVFLRLSEQDGETLRGTLRVNDFDLGLSIYTIEGTFDGATFKFVGVAIGDANQNELGTLNGLGSLTERGDIDGDWESSIGTAGKFRLTPQISAPVEDDEPDQLFTVRHQFGPIEATKAQIITLAEMVQKIFKNPVVITISGDTEVSCFLEKFKALSFTEDVATKVKIRAQEPDKGNLSRVVHIEFGPHENLIAVESTDEAWARGQKEMILPHIRRFEKVFTNRLKQSGITTGGILFLGMLLILPALPTFWQRILIMVLFLVVAQSLAAFEKRYLRLTTVWLTPKRKGRFGRWTLSWTVNILGTIVAAVLAAAIGGWLGV